MVGNPPFERCVGDTPDRVSHMRKVWDVEKYHALVLERAKQ